MKKRFALLLCAAMLLALTACSSGPSKKEQEEHIKMITEGDYLFPNDGSAELYSPGEELNAEEIYRNLTYTPEMFYGDYRILGGKEGEKAYAAEMSYIDFKTEYAQMLTAIPFQLKAGPENLSHIITNADDHHWLRAYYYTESGNLTFMLCAYTVSGHTITLQPLDEETYSYDSETGRLRYSLREETITYEFSFRGMELTLSNGSQSLKLYSNMWPSEDKPLVSADGYCRAGSPMIPGIDYIEVHWSDGKSRVYTQNPEGKTAYGAAAKMSSDGLFTITVPEGVNRWTGQFVYFNCGWDGLILTDGNTTYYYTDTYGSRYADQMGSNISVEEIDKLAFMDQGTLDDILSKRSSMLDDLSSAYEQAGLQITVNRETGEVMLDSAVLFGVDETQISDEGKEFLKRFMQIYTDVVFSEPYSGFVSKILIQGHTDTNGSYEMNQALSQARADSVRDYCLSSECGVDAHLEALSSMLLAQGYSYDNPILDAAGNVDMDASRRVSFLFLIDLE